MSIPTRTGLAFFLIPLLLPPPGSCAPALDCGAAYKDAYLGELELAREEWDSGCAEGLSPEDILGRARRRGADGPSETRPASQAGGPTEGALKRALEGDIPSRLDALYEGRSQGASLSRRPLVDGSAGRRHALEPPWRAAWRPSLRGGEPAGRDLGPQEVEGFISYKSAPTFLSSLPFPFGLLGRIVDTLLVRPIKSLFSSEDKDFGREVTTKLLESSEGRAIMGGLMQEYREEARTLTVKPERYPGTSLVTREGLEEIHAGPRGEANDLSGTYYYNAAYIRMKDRKAAVESAAATMGHELKHLWLHARMRRLMKKYHDIFEMALANEQSARLEGYIVAWQVQSGRHNRATRESERVASKPRQFFEEMKLWNPVYALSLDEEEMQDPVSAYEGRLQALEEEIWESKRELASRPVLIEKLDHMAASHVPPQTLRELREEAAAARKGLPYEIKGLEESAGEVRKRLERLKGRRGEEMVRRIREASNDPEFRELLEWLQRDLERLRRYVEESSLRAARTPGQTTIEEFRAQWDELHVPDQNDPRGWRER